MDGCLHLVSEVELVVDGAPHVRLRLVSHPREHELVVDLVRVRVRVRVGVRVGVGVGVRVRLGLGLGLGLGFG